MIAMDSIQLGKILSPSRVSGAPFSFHGVEIDSRKDCGGALFVAIHGDNFDGHDYVASAAEKGAVAAIVDRIVDVDIPQLVVEDTRQALGRIATGWRRTLKAKLIAITGSNGKTTVKEMLGQILSAQQPTLKTAGNLNNDIGVPLTLFRLSDAERYAVIEMGANHLHEIRQLVAIAEPDIVYVNNARAAHVEGFGSLDNVVSAKGEMYRYCRSAALAVFNDDEPAAAQWKHSCKANRQLVFSSRHPADVNVKFEACEEGLRLMLTHGSEQAECEIAVQGRHNAQNATAAISLAIASGLTLQQSAQGLQGFSGVSGRQQYKKGPQHSLIIDDSYNANPDSLAAAVDVLCDLPGQAWLALGDMAELGEGAAAMHDQAARDAHERGVCQFFALGEHSCHAALAFGDDGHCFSSHHEMASFIGARIHRGVNLLVKGSRSAKMETLVDVLTSDNSLNARAGDQHAV